MNKKDFLNKLASELKTLPPNIVSDILFDYQDYFDEKKGILSEEEAILSLGSINDLVENYKRDYSHLSKNRDFTQELPPIKDSSLSTSKYAISNNWGDATVDFSNSMNDEFSNETLDDISSTKSQNLNPTSQLTQKECKLNALAQADSNKKVTKKNFLGYLFSLPLSVIAIPIGLALGLSSGAIYVLLVCLIFTIGLLIFSGALIPFALSLAGLFIVLIKSFSPIIFISIPNFLTDFPSIILIFFSISLLFLSIGIFSLGISYTRLSKSFIFSTTKSIFNFIFKRGDLNEA